MKIFNFPQPNQPVIFKLLVTRITIKAAKATLKIRVPNITFKSIKLNSIALKATLFKLVLFIALMPKTKNIIFFVSNSKTKNIILKALNSKNTILKNLTNSVYKGDKNKKRLTKFSSDLFNKRSTTFTS